MRLEATVEAYHTAFGDALAHLGWWAEPWRSITMRPESAPTSRCFSCAWDALLPRPDSRW